MDIMVKKLYDRQEYGVIFSAMIRKQIIRPREMGSGLPHYADNDISLNLLQGDSRFIALYEASS
jgi:hypothetical protein